jgi:hypothetical protein
MPARGAPNQPPSTRNLADWATDPVHVAQARELFAGLGFQVGEASGGSFTIEGEAALYESCFGVRPRLGKAGTFQVAHAGSATAVLPLDRLPKALRRLVNSAGFAEPPAFGPVGFM